MRMSTEEIVSRSRLLENDIKVRIVLQTIELYISLSSVELSLLMRGVLALLVCFCMDVLLKNRNLKTANRFTYIILVIVLSALVGYEI